MRPFDELSQRGKAGRLRMLALDLAVAGYGLSDVRARLVAAHSFNTVFRIDSAEGRFALRVGGAHRIHQVGVQDVEAVWLAALAGSGHDVAQTAAMTDGRWWSFHGHVGVDSKRVCTMFTWLDGALLKRKPSEIGLRRAGRVLAELHEHAAASRQIRAIPQSLHARSTVYLGDTDRVSSYRSEHGSMFVEAIDRVQAFIDGLWLGPDRPHLLHGDFGPHNLLAWRGRLRPIDFQDLQFGHAVQDLGVTVADLRRNQPEMVKPFLQGYAEVRSLPELAPSALELLAAGRSLNIMNLALQAPESGFGSALTIHAGLVATWMGAEPA